MCEQFDGFHCSTLLIGRKRSGKTTFAINIVYRNMQAKINNVFVIHGEGFGKVELEDYKKITNKVYSTKDVPKIMKYIAEHREESLIIFEDTVTCNNSTLFTDLIYNCRHKHASVIVITQCLESKMPIPIKGFDNVVIMPHHSESEIKRMYELLNSNCDSLIEFQSIVHNLDYAKEPYTFLYLNDWLNSKCEYIVSKMYDDVIRIEKEYSFNDTDISEKKELLKKKLNNIIDQLIELRSELKDF